MKYDFKPDIFNPAVPYDNESIKSLLNSNNINIIDTFESQVIELHLCRNPQINSNSPNLSAETIIEKYSHFLRWVYYPWKNTIVSTLSESEFIEVRTNRNQQKITGVEQLELKNKTIGIVGLSVGSSIASCLALERVCGNIKLIDGDIIELSNLMNDLVECIDI
jgi:hypothetical protein